MKEQSFPSEGKEGQTLAYTHILDLADFGFIKPHIDSSRVKTKFESLTSSLYWCNFSFVDPQLQFLVYYLPVWQDSGWTRTESRWWMLWSNKDLYMSWSKTQHIFSQHKHDCYSAGVSPDMIVHMRYSRLRSLISMESLLISNEECLWYVEMKPDSLMLLLTDQLIWWKQLWVTWIMLTLLTLETGQKQTLSVQCWVKLMRRMFRINNQVITSYR